MDDWYTSFFTGDWIEIQRSKGAEESTLQNVALIRELLGIAPGMRILDVPVGTGRIALELAALGARVTGVDLSVVFLDDAARAAAERGLDLELRRSDMRDLPWTREFDAALCWWGSFGYFDDAGNAEFLRAVARTLRPGAPFIVEGHIAESLYPVFRSRGWSQHGETFILEERTMDIERGRIDATWRYLRDGHSSVARSSIRLYTYRELRELLESCGFIDVEGFTGTDSLEPFTFGSRRLIMRARRSEEIKG